jgi:3-deoxy-D-manno-octulosonate 8-phosphate phosphatase (KDO 8-P phosphatase)
MNLSEKAAKIKVVLTDVDGVLTDGSLVYGPEGVQGKSFFARDGVAVGMLRRTGLKVGFLTGRADAANRCRAEDLKVDFVCDGAFRKGEALLELCAKNGVNPDECLMIGDDLVDLPAMREAGLAVAVGDAVAELRAMADWVTPSVGGRGAFRDMAEWLLKLQGKWPQTLARWLPATESRSPSENSEPPIISG